MYDVAEDARDPVITEPVALTREAVDPLRARIARLFVVRFVVALLRDVTPRVVVGRVVRVGVIPRDVTVRFAAFPRDTAVLVGVFVARAVVARDTVARFVVVAAARGLVRPDFCAVAFGLTIGSANTERIETRVEQTKNAAANKNIVPIAFLTEFVFMRKFIKFSCRLLHIKAPNFGLCV